MALNYAVSTRDAASREQRMALAFHELSCRALTIGPGPILDIGCGPGWLTALLTEHGQHVVGVDISEAMIRLARSNTPRAAFMVSSLRQLPVRSASAAAVVCWFVLHHVPDDSVELALDEIVRVLVPNGVVLIGGHVGNINRVKTEGYGGLPMRVLLNMRPARYWADRLRGRGFTIDTNTTHDADLPAPWHVLFARKPTHAGS